MDIAGIYDKLYHLSVTYFINLCLNISNVYYNFVKKKKQNNNFFLKPQNIVTIMFNGLTELVQHYTATLYLSLYGVCLHQLSSKHNINLHNGVFPQLQHIKVKHVTLRRDEWIKLKLEPWNCSAEFLSKIKAKQLIYQQVRDFANYFFVQKP